MMQNLFGDQSEEEDDDEEVESEHESNRQPTDYISVWIKIQSCLFSLSQLYHSFIHLCTNVLFNC